MRNGQFLVEQQCTLEIKNKELADYMVGIKEPKLAHDSRDRTIARYPPSGSDGWSIGSSLYEISCITGVRGVILLSIQNSHLFNNLNFVFLRLIIS